MARDPRRTARGARARSARERSEDPRPRGGGSFELWRRPEIQRIYATVDSIPRGRVATYGQVAEEAGLPRRARLVGRALARLPDGSELPWHRVVNARGEISPRGSPAGEELQRRRLAREGVETGPGGRISLARFGWRP